MVGEPAGQLDDLTKAGLESRLLSEFGVDNFYHHRAPSALCRPATVDIADAAARQLLAQLETAQHSALQPGHRLLLAARLTPRSPRVFRLPVYHATCSCTHPYPHC